jgi:hypothetical protein
MPAIRHVRQLGRGPSRWRTRSAFIDARQPGPLDGHLALMCVRWRRWPVAAGRPGPPYPAAARPRHGGVPGHRFHAKRFYGHGVQGSASFTLHSNGFGASQRLASLTTYRSLTLTWNGLMLRGIFGLLTLVFDLPSIFLALVLDCLSVTLSLLCHTHNRLLSALGNPTPPRRTALSESALAASIRSSPYSPPDPSQSAGPISTLRIITVGLLSPHGHAHPSRADASDPRRARDRPSLRIQPHSRQRPADHSEPLISVRLPREFRSRYAAGILSPRSVLDRRWVSGNGCGCGGLAARGIQPLSGLDPSALIAAT